MGTALASTWSFDTNSSVERTLSRMRDRVRSCLRSSPLVVQTANDAVAATTSHDRYGQIDAIRGFLERVFRYVNDPVGVELLRDPAQQIAEIRQRGYTQGDCDE